MRAGDLAPPAVTPHVLPPDAPMARWPVQLRVALERLPQAAYVWDDEDPTVCWDDPNPDRLVWDAPFIGSGFTDSLCDLIALDIDPGEPDELGLFPPVHATLTLANPAGEYTPWTADGRLVYWAPGRRMCVWAVDESNVAWWLFSGRVSSWTLDAAGMVTVEAFDGLAALAQDVRDPWTPGVGNQRPLARIQAIAATAGYTDPIAGDLGDVLLTTAAVTDRSPLEACQVAALSDGGVFAGDADGRLIYRDRLWRAGRSDQAAIPVLSDNVCTVPAIVWDPELSTADDRLYTSVQLANAAGLTATAALSPSDPTAWYYGGPQYRLTHPHPDQWTTQAEGDALAAYLLAQTSTPAVALRAFTLHVHDPRQDLWPLIDLRRGDRLRLIHEFVDPAGEPGTLDVYVVAVAIGHQITPDAWTMTVAGTRTVDWVTVELWDDTRFTWDDPDPHNVWRY